MCSIFSRDTALCLHSFALILLAIIALSIVLFLRPDLLKQFGISKTEKQPEVVVMESTAGEKSVPVEPPSTASSKPANEPVFEKLERTPVTHQNPVAETAAAPAPAPIEEPAALPAAEKQLEIPSQLLPKQR